ncbi:hypothetical protein [Mesorhizobium sp.]|uniref:hypothetical protein n=1 Tax=Mesorhizobium sp. TaxID=1871066 RepID=UPI0011F8776D|nr:hypothetical protein [Mesorhizobium sp.]TIP07801.1 MAG: hypothetical protein E5X73_35245 [Mesorhizobium sp.]
MAGFEFFERDLKLATAGMEPETISKALAAFSRQELKRVIAEGIASPIYDRYVNGVYNAPEEAVKAPGPIVYEFINWPLVINAALQELIRRSPRRSGRYAGSFVVVVGGRTVVTDYSRLRADAEVIIFNVQPYTRKTETGYNGPGKRHFELSKGALNRRFNGVFRFETKYVDVPGGINPLAPYKLRRTTRRRAAGTPLTYPAIIINPVS